MAKVFLIGIVILFEVVCGIPAFKDVYKTFDMNYWFWKMNDSRRCGLEDDTVVYFLINIFGFAIYFLYTHLW